MSKKRAKLDAWSLRAQKEGYPARSVYKLEEMDRKFRFIRKGQKILDLGAAPGSWTLYGLRRLGNSGSLVSVDLKQINLKGNYPHWTAIQGDIFNDEVGSKLKSLGPYHFVMSDAAPNTSGNRLVDTRRSYDLVERILSVAEEQLMQGGAFVAKIFQGGDEEEIFEKMKTMFKSVKRAKPKAVRPESFESYFIGLDYLGAKAHQVD